MADPAPAFVTIARWCELSGMSRTSVYEALGSGQLSARKLGKRVLIDVEAGLAWVRSLPPVKIARAKQQDSNRP